MASLNKRPRERRSDGDARGVARTLAVIQSLNAQNGQTVSELSRRTGISRPALYRILNGLMDAGFVCSGRIPHTFIMTSRVRSLSRGYTDDNLISEVSEPVLDQLQKKTVWPTELATMRNFRMQLQDTTRHRSPMVIDGEVIGRTIPLLNTALGGAYLSRCSPQQLQTIMGQLRADKSRGESIPTERMQRQLLDVIRKKGYAWRDGGMLEGFNYQTSSIAIPISDHNSVIAAIGITFFSSALSIDEAARKYLADLTNAGRLIERRLAKTEA